MTIEITPQHQWLQKLVGEWTFESEASCDPGRPTTRSTGTEVGRSIGGAWAIVDGRGELPGGAGACAWMLTLGFDPRTGRFVGTWLGSMMPQLWVYDGTLDAAGRVLTLECDGPSFADASKLARYRDAFEFVNDDERVLRASVRGDDGTWTEFMTTRSRRVR